MFDLFLLGGGANPLTVYGEVAILRHAGLVSRGHQDSASRFNVPFAPFYTPLGFVVFLG